MLDDFNDDILFYLIMNTLSIPELESFKLINKRIGDIYIQILYTDNLREQFIQNHYDFVKKNRSEYFFLKGTNFRWGPFVSYYENGNVYNRLFYVNDKLEGIQKTYHKNGTLRCQYNYINGEIEGFVKMFDDEGNIDSWGMYVNGKREGLWNLGGSKRRYKSIGKYINDKQEGTWIKFENGSLIRRGIFINGEKEGTWERFIDGKKVYETEYINGVIQH